MITLRKLALLILEWFYWFVFCLALFFISLVPVWSYIANFNSPPLLSNRTFDYIIVGGGSAGCLLASRLSSIKNITVLVLEAGPTKPSVLNAPALGPMFLSSAMDWRYSTTPQTHACKALKDQRSNWPLGKVLGGTTHLNYMLHVAGHIDDFTGWNHSSDWSEQEIRYYLKRAENDLPLRTVPHTTHLSSAVTSAAEELSRSVSEVPLGLDTRGAFAAPLVTITGDGTRWTADQFLYRRKRENLIVKTGIQVRRILVNKNKIAYGVEILQSGQLVNILARREIILTAGAVHSPHILMFSGIGPRKALEEANITLIQDLPVGRNLQDHVTTGLDLILSDRPIFGLSHLTSPISFFQYLAYGAGPLTSTLCEMVALQPLNDRHNVTSRRPDFQLMVMMAGASSDGGLHSRHVLGIKDEVWSKYFAPLIGKQTVSIMPVLLHPLSTGQVSLDPDDPTGQPRVNPMYLTHPTDLDTLVRAVQFVYRLVTTKAMRDMGFRPNRRVFPGCETSGVFGSPEYWRCYVTHFTLTSYHPVGTCALGKVVTSDLRVRGIINLRVADASTIPSIPGGNTHAAVALVAHKASDLIVKDWCADSEPCLVVNAFIPLRQCCFFL